MNCLFNMLLSGDDDQLLVGNFMGDFIKGNLNDRFPRRISRGIALHSRNRPKSCFDKLGLVSLMS